MIIESSFRSLIIALKNPKKLEIMSSKYPSLKASLEKLPPNSKEKDFLKVILDDPSGEEFLTRNLQNIYPQWAKAFGMKDKNTAFKS